MHKKYGGEDFVAVSLSLDDTKDKMVRAKVDEFLQKKQATFTNLIAEGDVIEWYDRLKVGSVPAVFVFDRQNRRVQKLEGEQVDYQNIEAEVAKLLKK